jgi:hypothetical protein
MADIPARPNGTVEQIYRAYQRAQEAEPPRKYLGASILGYECDRRLWLGFRLVFKEKFEGRMLRLFRRGHREEPELVRDLESIGCQVETVDPATGDQFAFKAADGHLGGHMDAAILGLPEAPKSWHLGEFKTHNDESFRELCKKGVAEAKPAHWAQMQLYMRWTGMERAAYFAVNKNDDTIYFERVHYDREAAERLEKRGERLVFMQHPPERISEKPDWYQCKMCPAFENCHGNKMPLVNCRTCAHATPARGGDARWICERKGVELTFDEQQKGCGDHVYLPAILPRVYEQVDASPEENWIEYQVGSERVRNGTERPGVLPSTTLCNIEGPPSIVVELLAKFGGRVLSPEEADAIDNDPTTVALSGESMEKLNKTLIELEAWRSLDRHQRARALKTGKPADGLKKAKR